MFFHPTSRKVSSVDRITAVMRSSIQVPTLKHVWLPEWLSNFRLIKFRICTESVCMQSYRGGSDELRCITRSHAPPLRSQPISATDDVVQLEANFAPTLFKRCNGKDEKVSLYEKARHANRIHYSID